MCEHCKCTGISCLPDIMSKRFVSRLAMFEAGCRLIMNSNGYLNVTDCISWTLLAYV